MRLLILPPPYIDESLGGYILRLTERNDYPNTNYIYSFLNTNQKLANNPYKLDIVNTELDQLSILLNIKKDILISMLIPFKEINSSTSLVSNDYQTHTHSKFFSLNNRICPQCLKESGYIKKYWDIFFVTTCSEHNCLLIDECPNCNKKVKYNRKSIFECRCGFDLRSIKPCLLDINANYVTNLILNICGYSEEVINSPLSRISFEEVVESFLLIIRHIYKQRYISSPKLDIKTLHSYLVMTYQVFEDWPESFYKILDEYEDKNEKVFGIRSFGEFYQLCFGNRYSHFKIDIIRNAYQFYIESKWKNGHAFLLKNVNFNKDNLEYINLSRAAEILNKSEESVKELLENGILKGVIKQGTKINYYIISIKSVNDYKSRSLNTIDTTITQQEIEKILEINHSALKKMRNEGMLTPVNSPKLGSNEGYRYRLEDIEYLFKLIEKKLYSDDIDCSQWIPFSVVRKLLNCSFVSLIKYMENNSILVYKKNGTNNLDIKNYLFYKEEVLHKVKKGINGYSRRDLCKIFNVSSTLIEGWVNSGYLPYELNKSKKVIKDKQINYFRHNYITLNNINFGENLNEITAKVKYLESRRIFPIDSINGCLYSIGELKARFKQDFVWPQEEYKD
ncbi:TniQ family protein [Metabacillus litoralis]|uniref:TniQ family protein n=1 Tax=Metabacillus litoralis TaxID=152268 RepID=UPI00203DEE17|nr:TniQ family protein [Metabacillus litoralis]MCM3410176.1 TniQ family protein [Metabacillus litoralis]